MTTEVYSIVPVLHHIPSLVCQLTDITPDEAIERLRRAGVLAVEGIDGSSVVLLGFNCEVSRLIADLRKYGFAREPTCIRTMGKMRALAS